MIARIGRRELVAAGSMKYPNVGAPARPKGVPGKGFGIARNLTALGGAPRAVAPNEVSGSLLQSSRLAEAPA